MNSAHFYMNTGDLGSYFNLRTFGKTQRITNVTVNVDIDHLLSCIVFYQRFIFPVLQEEKQKYRHP